MIDNFIDSLDDSSNIKILTKSKQIHMSSNNMPGPEKKKKNLDEKKHILKNRSQEYQ